MVSEMTGGLGVSGGSRSSITVIVNVFSTVRTLAPAQHPLVLFILYFTGSQPALPTMTVSESDLNITLGVEEEFFLVDPGTRDLESDPNPGIFEACERNRGPHTVAHEVLRTQIETSTRVCGSVRETRRLVIEAAAEHGVGVMAASTHPFAEWKSQLITPRERYERFVVTLQESVRQQLIGGMHIHAGFGSPDSRIRVMTAML